MKSAPVRSSAGVIRPASSAGAKTSRSAAGSHDWSPSSRRIAHTSATRNVRPEDRGLGEGRARVVGEVGGAALDERPDAGGDEPGGPRRQRPRPVHALEQARVAVGAHELLDHERHTLGLRLDRRDRLRRDRPAQRLAEHLGRFGEVESRDLDPPDQPHPVHVGEQRDELRRGGGLLGPERHRDEHRQAGLRSDEVAQQAQAVLVGPLEVVEQERDRSPEGRQPERESRLVDDAERALVRRETRECRVVLAREDLARTIEGRGRALGAALAELVRGEDPPRDEERAADLLVARDGDGGEIRGQSRCPRR